MKMLACAVVLLVCVMTVPASAEPVFDGVKPLICATIQAVSCTAGEECERGLPESVGAPQFFRIDFVKKEIIGPVRTTQIRLMETTPAQITLQGFELGMGWAITLDRETGKTVTTLAGREEGFVLFGACTSP
jgi:hypothetical protein